MVLWNIQDEVQRMKPFSFLEWWVTWGWLLMIVLAAMMTVLVFIVAKTAGKVCITW